MFNIFLSHNSHILTFKFFVHSIVQHRPALLNILDCWGFLETQLLDWLEMRLTSTSQYGTICSSLARGYDNGVYSILISIRVGSSLLCPFAQDGLPPVGMPLVIASGKAEAGQPVTKQFTIRTDYAQNMVVCHILLSRIWLSFWQVNTLGLCQVFLLSVTLNTWFRKCVS